VFRNLFFVYSPKSSLSFLQSIMADPVSILASIAGVATAGVSISMCLYDITHTLKQAPKEVADMAKELSLLSSILRNLRSVIKQSAGLCKPRLIADTKEVLGKIKGVFRDIKALARDSCSALNRLKWLFRSSRAKAMLARIEGFKATVNLILGTLQLAAIQKQNSK
jgi:hypothetical protein